MSLWNLIIDVALCENCNNCVLANKDEYVDNRFPGYSAPQPLHGEATIRIHRKVRGEGHLVDAAYLPTLCNHCDNAPCLKAGGDAVRKRPDGIIIIDPVKAKGRRDLVSACPYGAIIWNEVEQLPQAWTFDAHLLDQGWKEPRGAQACPTDAMKAVKLDAAAMARLASEQKLEVLKPELGTKPRVYYHHLHRYSKNFVGGSVVAQVASQRECVADARVTLMLDGRELQQTTTDTFGDFKFDALDATAGRWLVRIDHASYGKASVEAPVTGSTQVLGEIELQRLTVAA